MYTNLQSENFKGRRLSRDLSVSWRVMWNGYQEGENVDMIRLVQITDQYEHGNDPPGSIKGEEFLGYLREYYLY
jgi:hypothetical protein